METGRLPIMPPVHLYISPHLDDAIFSCAGLMYEQRKNGERVMVISIFAKNNAGTSYHAFARHLHAKWGLSNLDAFEARRKEDASACAVLGVESEHCDFSEAQYRYTQQGLPLYCSYDAIENYPYANEPELENALTDFLRSRIQKEQSSGFSPIIYVPLPILCHVDHYLVCKAAQRLQAKDMLLRYYEPWPHVEKYCLKDTSVNGWKATIYPIELKVKTKAMLCYVSQMSDLGCSLRDIRKRIKNYAFSIGKSLAAERAWENESHFLFHDPGRWDEELPFTAKTHKWRLGDFKIFLKSLRWHDVFEFLPKGEGVCLDVGCGTGRHKEVAQHAGYKWIGLDYFQRQFHLAGDAHNLAVRSESVACVIFWTVTSLLKEPAQAFREIFRVLEPGGVLCGSSSFLEPLHGQSTYGMSHVIIERILRENGFEDIQIIPDISGFALILWTWLRRYGGDGLAKLALPITSMWLVPLALIRFMISWVFWRLGCGSGHGMNWVTKNMPLEFAGHIMFTARKVPQKN